MRVFPDNSCLVGSCSFKNLSSAVYYYTKHKINGVFLYDPTVRSVVNMFSVNNFQPMWLDLLIDQATTSKYRAHVLLFELFQV